MDLVRHQPKLRQKKARKMGKRQAGGFPTSGEEEWLESGGDREDERLPSTECDVSEREKELENELKVKERTILKLKLQLRNERTEAKERQAALSNQFDKCFRKYVVSPTFLPNLPFFFFPFRKPKLALSKVFFGDGKEYVT